MVSAGLVRWIRAKPDSVICDALAAALMRLRTGQVILMASTFGLVLFFMACFEVRLLLIRGRKVGQTSDLRLRGLLQ